MFDLETGHRVDFANGRGQLGVVHQRGKLDIVLRDLVARVGGRDKLRAKLLKKVCFE
jgi:hypothetical protein